MAKTCQNEILPLLAAHLGPDKKPPSGKTWSEVVDGTKLGPLPRSLPPSKSLPLHLETPEALLLWSHVLYAAIGFQESVNASSPECQAACEAAVAF
mmetsp:Transcript_18417/g.51615  ORF Transcript_18417/g.51615 Transcript_18417/m.51615 type:complete len:96 (-) Transcript_18417:613-900(-)